MTDLLLHIPSGNVIKCPYDIVKILFIIPDNFYFISKYCEYLKLFNTFTNYISKEERASYVDIFWFIRENMVIEEFEVLDD